MKFKKYHLLFCFSFFFTGVCAQSTQSSAAKIYALVVGISGYQDAAIPKLNYADKDARLFSQWLHRRRRKACKSSMFLVKMYMYTHFYKKSDHNYNP